MCGEGPAAQFPQSSPVSSAVRPNRERHAAASRGLTSSPPASFSFFSFSTSCQVSWVEQRQYLSPSLPSVSSPSLIENSCAHLTRPQQGPPAIWPHLHATALAANETLWRSCALMLPPPATDFSNIWSSKATGAKALNCRLEILDSLKEENR